MKIFQGKLAVSGSDSLQLPLASMNIAVYLNPPSTNPVSNFIVETFFPLFSEAWEHRTIIITDVSKDFSLATVQKITIRPQPNNRLLRKFWIERTLVTALKKTAADIFICGDSFCSLNTSVPQFVLYPDPKKLELSMARKARLIIVSSESAKKELLSKLKIDDEKLVIIYPGAGRKYLSIDTERRESIKTKYTEGKEYFLFNSTFRDRQDLVNLLKSFSQFKKRQQSNFKMLLTSEQNFPLDRSIDNYKYRSDVVIVSPISVDEKAAIISAAYAVILPFYTPGCIALALNAMQSGVPVIATEDSSINEIGGDAVLFATDEIKDIGEKMMQLYKDENLRSQLIEKGNALVKNFTMANSANQLKRTIMKAVN